MTAFSKQQTYSLTPNWFRRERAGEKEGQERDSGNNGESEEGKREQSTGLLLDAHHNQECTLSSLMLRMG